MKTIKNKSWLLCLLALVLVAGSYAGMHVMAKAYNDCPGCGNLSLRENLHYSRSNQQYTTCSSCGERYLSSYTASSYWTGSCSCGYSYTGPTYTQNITESHTCTHSHSYTTTVSTGEN